MKQTYERTLAACYTGYVVQAIVNNFIPLLFLTFQSTYHISMSSITLLITANFLIQLLIDCLCAGFVDRIGYRASMILAHAASAAGLVCLTFLPDLLPDPFIGLLISVAIYALGGGLLEVLLSPIVEALPTDHKEKTMSLLHSFYCWGHVAVGLVATIFFYMFGLENCKRMARMVALGDFHISFKLYSFTRAAFGVMVAHFTATPYFFVASAESTVTWSFVASRCSRPRS